MSKALNLLWLQSGGCGGCTMSLLNAEQPTLFQALENSGINILWHASLSATPSDNLLETVEQILSGKIALDILCVEGAAITGPDGTGAYHIVSGSETPMMNLISELANFLDISN